MTPQLLSLLVAISFLFQQEKECISWDLLQASIGTLQLKRGLANILFQPALYEYLTASDIFGPLYKLWSEPQKASLFDINKNASQNRINLPLSKSNIP